MSQATHETEAGTVGTISRVSGPVVTATGLAARMNDVVHVGEEELMGEVIEIEGDLTTIQVYEETSGVSPGEPVTNTGEPLTVDLGPGMLDSIYDGVQRPLDILESQMGTPFLDRGVDAPGIDMDRTWEFEPVVEEGDSVAPGDIVGVVPETESIDHRVMVPPDVDGGEVTAVESGSLAVTDTVVELDDGETITMHQEWPVREPRPAIEKHSPTIPLISGQRILDGLFPIAKGGTAAIPGPFGSGKCVTPETPVMLADGRTERIESLFERLTEREDVPATGDVLLEGDERILTFDQESASIRPSSISHVYRGTTDRLVRIRTASGRTLEVTPDHKLFRMAEGLEVQEVPAGALLQGDSLIMPRRLSVPGESVPLDAYDLVPEARAVEPEVQSRVQEAIAESETTNKQLAEIVGVSDKVMQSYANGYTTPTLAFIRDICDHLEVERPPVSRVKPGNNGKTVRLPDRVDSRLGEFLGLLLSDGAITDRTVRFHNNDDPLRARFADLAADLFDVEVRGSVHNTVSTALIHSRVLTEFLAALGVPTEQKSRTCGVPDVVKRSGDGVVAAFLRGYYLGDGSITMGTVAFSTSSAEMASDLPYLLARTGVLYRVEKRENGAHRIFISGGEAVGQLHKTITDGSEHRKLAAMRTYAKSTIGNTSVDTIPIDEKTIREIADLARYAEFKDAGIEITNYTNLGQSPRKRAIGLLESVVADGGTSLSTRLSSVVEMLDDIFFDPIEELEFVHEEQVVYDVTVPGTENFIGGTVPAVLHNTVTQHSLAKWADADIVVYVGCGERGNEMTEVIEDFPELEDPVTGKPLMARTCLIANTSNMPVAARESCVYTGITIAEYYRDMGYDVALMADSTSRWAEAMREISSRLEEMPGEEGYPAYLAARLSQFYERSGRFTLLNEDEGSVSVIGAVSPPGGDFSEPVTQNTLRIVKTFWALDADLAERRHFPAINWDDSYSLYRNQLDSWFVDEVAEDWPTLRQWAIDMLAEETELQEIVQLVGKDALPDDQQLTLEVARYLREGFLQQNAFHDVDQYCEPAKTYRIWEAIKTFSDEAFKALEAGVPVEEIQDIDDAYRLNRIGPQADYEEYVAELEATIAEQLRELY